MKNLFENRQVTLQWIPSHCNIHGNEKADTLAKEGSTEPQADSTATFREEKTIIKNKMKSKWKARCPNSNAADPYYRLNRREQVIIFRLRTGHNRLRYHLYRKFKIGMTERCPCGSAVPTADHILQECRLFSNERKRIWTNPVQRDWKLYGDLEALRSTVAFIDETGLFI